MKNMGEQGVSTKKTLKYPSVEEDTKSTTSRDFSRESSSDDDVTIYLPQSHTVHNR